MIQQTTRGDRSALDEALRQTGVFRCLECGKCTAICPISHYDHRFSPRRTVGRALMRRDRALLGDDRLWACLTCWHCSQVCPAGVAYPDLTLAVRAEARRLGAAAVCTHGEAIHAWMRLMMDPALEQDRLGWLTSSAFQVTSDEFRVSSFEFHDTPKELETQNSELVRTPIRSISSAAPPTTARSSSRWGWMGKASPDPRWGC